MAVHERGSGRKLGVRTARARIAACLAAALLAALALPHQAAAAEKNAVLIVDANTGRTIYASAADALRHPASLAKMMTLYIVFEQIEQGRLSYQTAIKVSAAAAAAAPSKLGLEEGDEIRLIDAIKALITKSANDAAVAVAEHIAGSEAKFARLMTQKAARLGMKSTVFKNASGLPDDEQVTTARDMVSLALRLQDDFPRHYPLFATRTFTYGGDTYRNHNSLLASYEGTDGLKTGYTKASGFNLVASVRRGRKHIVGAVFGGASASQRDRTMRTFLNIGLVKASHVKTRIPAPALAVEAKVAEVPSPQRLERVPRPAPAKAPEPAAQAAKGVEIARVRPVLVAPRPAAAGPDRVGAAAEGSALEPPAQATQWATTTSGAALARAPASTRGDKASSLDEQAARLAAGRAPLEGQATAAAAKGGFHIQIGAFQSLAEAERQLAAARERAPSVLRPYAPMTMQFKQGDKLFHRARFAGFDAQGAASACSELKRLKVDCLVVKGE